MIFKSGVHSKKKKSSIAQVPKGNANFISEAFSHWSSPHHTDQGKVYETKAALKLNLTSPELNSRRWRLLKYIHWAMPSLILNITSS